MSRAALCAAALLMLPVAALPQPPARDNVAPATGTARIRGRVVDSPGNRPLSRVEIRAASGTGTSASALTDAEGRYELTDLPAGTYTVSATKANYIRTSWGEQRAEGPGKRIALADGQRLDNINISLRRAGVITGRIVDEFGDPVTDVSVMAMRYQYVQGSRRLMPSGRGGQTNDVGEFRLYGLSPGQYFVSATLRSFIGPSTDVTDRTGYAPTFYPGTGNVAEAQRVSVSPGQTIASVNIALLPIQTSKITGIVLDSDGRPLPAVAVNLMQRIGFGQFGANFAPVAADGRFTIANVTPGEYTIRVNQPTGDGASVSADITVTGSDINDVRLIVAKPSTLRGRIVFTPSATADGPPKPTAIDLGAWREWALGQPVRSTAKIKEDGTFELSLAAGHVQIRAAPTAAGGSNPWRLNRVILHDADVGDTGIEVPPNATIDNIFVEMTNHVGETSGRVTDADGSVVRDCFVIVFAQDPVHWTVQTRYVSIARPGPDDLYTVRLLPGDYYAVAMTDVEQGAWTDPDFLSQARDHATKFSIGDGEKKTVDLRVTPAPVF